MRKNQENASRRARSPIPGPPDSSSINLSDTPGWTLLAGLVGFIRPHVDAYATATDSPQARADFDLRAQHVCSGAQGHELLSALGKFVKELTVPYGDIIAKGGVELVASRDEFTQDLEKIPARQHVSIAMPMTTENLSQTIVNQVHQHVFNEMPIRMLAFDSNGTQLRLVERSEIAEQIKSRISEKEWQGLDEFESLDSVKELGKYAILSHTWFRGGDVVFDDWNKRELNTRGNSKIVKFCEVAARNHGVVYGWMDTVCIDKSSSTELDESIRSMYRWYRQSHVCITYLADTSETPDMHRDTWFTRGWTLQELLAPQNMVFYSKNWSFLTRNDGQMNLTMQDLTQITLKTFPAATQSQISQATSIESNELGMCFMDPGLLPISRIFQLACRRNVTREEDRVYSLMGLLGISISVAYGEGLPGAFKRLVREIMVTKNNFLDIFNHSGMHQLIPISMSTYENRSPLFDQTSSHRPTALHQKQYMEPIFMTHLGAQVPILLIPMFQNSTFEALIPSAARPRSINALRRADADSTKYLLLERNSISTEFISSHKATSFVWNAGGDRIIFCGILNFWKSGAVYQTSNIWLYVSVGFGPRTGSDVTDMQLLSGPLVLSWPSENPSGYENIREQDIPKMGMKVTTLYFK